MLRKKCHVVRKKNHVVRKLFYVASIFGGAASRENRPLWEVSPTAARRHPLLTPSKEKTQPVVADRLRMSGKDRIRTCEPVLPVTRFPGVPLQPLEHLSGGAFVLKAVQR